MFDRKSKIRDIWNHPVGHDILQALSEKQGRPRGWFQTVFIRNQPVSRLDTIAGPGFTDLLLEMVATYPNTPETPRPEHRAWWKESVMYQVYLPSFMDSDHDGIGDLNGIIQRLPYLSKLGINTICLWPLVEMANDGGVVNYTAISPDFGTIEDFQNLVELAHTRDIHVVVGMDISATSENHAWYKNAVEGKPESAYYIFKKGSAECPPNNWCAPAYISPWRWVPSLNSWNLRLSGRNWADLNWGNPKLRSQITNSLQFWIDTGIDGLYFSSVNHLDKSDITDGNSAASNLFGLCGYEKYGFGQPIHSYLKELRGALQTQPNFFIGGETRGIGTGLARLFTGEQHAELDMILDTSNPSPRNKKQKGGPTLTLQDLKSYYLHWMEEYGNDRWMSLFFETPKTPRFISRLEINLLYRSIVSKLLGAMLLTLRGTPILFQGQELGLPNTRFNSAEELRDPVSIRMFNEWKDQLDSTSALQKVLPFAADHARTPMPWNAGLHGGFTGARPWMRMPDGIEYMNVAVQTEDPNSIWHFYQRLIAMRKKYPCLVYGRFNSVFSDHKKLFCYFRIDGNEKVYVELNLSEKEVSRPGRILPSQKLILSNYDTPSRSLRPYEANLYICE